MAKMTDQPLSAIEPERSGFETAKEDHPSEIVEGGHVNGHVGIKELREAIPAHCFEPTLHQSFFYLFRDLTYSMILLALFYCIPKITATFPNSLLYYPLMLSYSFAQGIVWTGLWIIAHECGHSAFSKYSVINDSIGWTLHSFLLAPYFSWKSTHRRHHIYANHIDKDLVYVPLRRDKYAAMFGIAPGQLDELGEDAPVVLFLRIILQQAVGWNWYIISNITCSPDALLKQGMGRWRHSHFDPWGSLFRSSEAMAIILSDIGCLITLTGVYALCQHLGSFEQVFWLYLAPWAWVNQWIVMITYLHHTHPTIPKYANGFWTFTLGAIATMDRDYGIIGTHFFHHISSDHVVHHLFSKIPHYHSREATNAIVPLLGNQYHGRGSFGWGELLISFKKCQWVQEDASKDKKAFGDSDTEGLWYEGGPSPNPEYCMRAPEAH
ncbi:oleate delta-12 desaturase [Phlyctema vagabunda]|uniref:Oleate delta-12 desaturase n=1 Tax=Phlyctema vagabunda TaxID=108571 RepID=A0ABR4PRI4_9HELO